MNDASRVLLGLGGCVDYELTLTAEALSRLVAEHGIANLTAPTTVDSERDLVVSILGYVARGGGGEHFVASAPALSQFADRFPHKETLGGTSVRAGLLMSRLGVPSTLHLVTVNDTFRRLLPAGTAYVTSGTEDTCYPHLIVQYEQGLHVTAGDIDILAPAPNRLIYVNDPANSDMHLTADLGDRLGAAEIFLISGFNAMRDAADLDTRLAVLRNGMRRLPPGSITYFEDAAYHEPAFSSRVRAALLDKIDVYGLNEDELQSYLGHPVDLLSAPAVAEALTTVHKLIPAPTLVLHTRYWALALGTGSYAGALDTGTVMAAARYAYGDGVTDAEIADLRRQPRRRESAAFAAELHTLTGAYVVPAFALDIEHPTTVGLGDTFVGGFLAELALTGPLVNR
jgi:ADP-dependent phosphofructokinase/glucokinase